VKRRTDVVGIFPNEEAITRLVGAILLEQNDEWAVQSARMTLETVAPLSNDATISRPLWQSDIPGQTAGERNEHAGSHTNPEDTIHDGNTKKAMGNLICFVGFAAGARATGSKHVRI
jgi:Transposase, Mutator family